MGITSVSSSTMKTWTSYDINRPELNFITTFLIFDSGIYSFSHSPLFSFYPYTIISTIIISITFAMVVLTWDTFVSFKKPKSFSPNHFISTFSAAAAPSLTINLLRFQQLGSSSFELTTKKKRHHNHSFTHKQFTRSSRRRPPSFFFKESD